MHQAIDTKEGVSIKEETSTLATITYQNFFRLYDKLAGMTGTAKTEEEEFLDIYNMRVIEIPTNRPVQRIDYPDAIFANPRLKFAALVKEVKELYEKGSRYWLERFPLKPVSWCMSCCAKSGFLTKC